MGQPGTSAPNTVVCVDAHNVDQDKPAAASSPTGYVYIAGATFPNGSAWSQNQCNDVPTLAKCMRATAGPKTLYVPSTSDVCAFDGGATDLGDVVTFVGGNRGATAAEASFAVSTGANTVTCKEFPIFDGGWRYTGGLQPAWSFGPLADDTEFTLQYLNGTQAATTAGTGVSIDFGTPVGAQRLFIEMRGNANFSVNSALQFLNIGTCIIRFRLYDTAVLDLDMIDNGGAFYIVEVVSAGAQVLNGASHPEVGVVFDFGPPSTSIQFPSNVLSTWEELLVYLTNLACPCTIGLTADMIIPPAVGSPWVIPPRVRVEGDHLITLGAGVALSNWFEYVNVADISLSTGPGEGVVDGTNGGDYTFDGNIEFVGATGPLFSDPNATANMTLRLKGNARVNPGVFTSAGFVSSLYVDDFAVVTANVFAGKLTQAFLQSAQATFDFAQTWRFGPTVTPVPAVWDRVFLDQNNFGGTACFGNLFGDWNSVAAFTFSQNEFWFAETEVNFADGNTVPTAGTSGGDVTGQRWTGGGIAGTTVTLGPGGMSFDNQSFPLSFTDVHVEATAGDGATSEITSDFDFTLARSSFKGPLVVALGADHTITLQDSQLLTSGGEGGDPCIKCLSGSTVIVVATGNSAIHGTAILVDGGATLQIHADASTFVHPNYASVTTRITKAQNVAGIAAGTAVLAAGESAPIFPAQGITASSRIVCSNRDTNGSPAIGVPCAPNADRVLGAPTVGSFIIRALDATGTQVAADDSDIDWHILDVG